MKEFFNHIASEEKENFDYNLLSRQFLAPSKKAFSFLQKYGDLCNFWYDLLFNNINLDKFKSKQTKFLKDLMNGFEVYKTIKKPKNELDYEAKDLYLKLLGNPDKSVNNIFLNKPKDKNNEEIYLQVRILFDLREKDLKNCLIKKS